MYTCVICHFEVSPDDACCPTSDGLCVCVRCYARTTETERPIAKNFRREIEYILSDVASSQGSFI